MRTRLAAAVLGGAAALSLALPATAQAATPSNIWASPPAQAVSPSNIWASAPGHGPIGTLDRWAFTGSTFSTRSGCEAARSDYPYFTQCIENSGLWELWVLAPGQ